MISAFANVLLFGFKPVTPELIIYITNTFSGFYKCKANLYIAILHIFYLFPVYRSLVTAHINTMYLITGRYCNLKAGIEYIGRNNKKINCIVNRYTCNEKPKKYFEKIF